jgi:hypothetical protein
MQPILIVLHGVKRAGKNTTADRIERFVAENFPALRVAQRGFADYAKLAFARQFFPKIEMAEAIAWVDKYKESDRIFRVPGIDTYAHDVPFRQGLAHFATEGARDIYGDDFWVDLLLPTNVYMDETDQPTFPAWREEFFHADICLVTDNRFANEVVRTKMLGGQAWKIKRKEAEDAVIAEAAAQGREIHRSELGLPDELFDVVLDGEGLGLSYFYTQVDAALTLLLRERQVA